MPSVENRSLLWPPIGVRARGRDNVGASTVPRRGRRIGRSREQFRREQGLTLSRLLGWRRALGKTAAPGGMIAGEPLFFERTAKGSASAGVWDVELQLGASVFLRLRRPCRASRRGGRLCVQTRTVIDSRATKT